LHGRGFRGHRDGLRNAAHFQDELAGGEAFGGGDVEVLLFDLLEAFDFDGDGVTPGQDGGED
jgi:hypothetical protein